MERKDPIRVGIRGAAGLLGSRLAAAIHCAHDMSLEAGVVLPDRTLEATLNRCRMLKGYTHNFPKRMFVQSGNHGERESEVVRRLNAEHALIQFEGASQLNWRALTDVIVDTAYPAGKETFADQYRTFPGTILLQDGASPEGRLVVPPLVAREEGARINVYRIGDCILSGIVPILYPFRELAFRVRVHMLTQFDGREADYLITERAHAFYVRNDIREKVERELSVLFPDQEVAVQAVVQIPSILHYQATLELELREPIAHDALRQLFQEMPRVLLVPASVSSTYDINLARSFSDAIPPIMVFEHALHPQTGARSNLVRIVAAIYYRTAAVLPNVDAIRMLTRGTDPLEAMRQTDRDMGFAPME